MKKKHREFREMLHKWLDTDMVKAGSNFNKIERGNEAFARGWRFGIHSVIQKLDDYDL